MGSSASARWDRSQGHARWPRAAAPRRTARGENLGIGAQAHLGEGAVDARGDLIAPRADDLGANATFASACDREEPESWKTMRAGEQFGDLGTGNLERAHRRSRALHRCRPLLEVRQTQNRTLAGALGCQKTRTRPAECERWVGEREAGARYSLVTLRTGSCRSFSGRDVRLVPFVGRRQIVEVVIVSTIASAAMIMGRTHRRGRSEHAGESDRPASNRSQHLRLFCRDLRPQNVGI